MDPIIETLRQSNEYLTLVVASPPSGATQPSTLDRERDGDMNPQRKDYIIDTQNALNAPGYIARAWAHYKQHLEGPHSQEQCHKVKVIVETNPQTRL